MMFSVEIQNENRYPLDRALLEQAAEVVLTQQRVQLGSALTIVITDDDSVADLNQRYRQVDTPTDVLSFPASIPIRENEPPYLGDIIIAYPYAAHQADREGHNVADSLAVLIIHGVLHLLGYDHESLESRTTMWGAQDAALRALRIPLEIVPALESYGHEQ
jgi:probable rRNA maturation factor